MDDKLLKIINSRQLVSVMNKTKWQELCEEFEGIQNWNVKVRYKLITSNKLLGFSPVWWFELFEETPLIEWLEFDLVVPEYKQGMISQKETDRSVEIVNILRKHSIRYSREQSYFKVWGYISAATNPEFV